ncbi:MAG: AMP-binding protein, partial [Cytophagaceae bacterium]|nr:AMP-binding protein [Gemmatimonadaceae bacterium]
TRVLSFGELDDRANRVAAALEQRGVRLGERVAAYLTNRLEFIDLFLATTRLGAILVPINVLYREREIAHIVADAEPLAVVTTRDAMSLLPAGTVAWDVEELTRIASEGAVERIRRPMDGDAPAALVYTSGTTGRSKGAVLTHNNFLANGANLLACWRIVPEDRYLAALPLFHVHGLGNGVVSWLMSGCRMRLVERFDASRIAAVFHAFHPTLFFGVPTMYVRLLDVPVEDAKAIGAHMRLFVCGSAPLPAAVFETFHERFGHVILERYGMSETLMNLGNPYAGERRPGSVGFPLPGVSVRIVDPAGHAVDDGEIGQLLVRGPNVCAGYWRRPDADADAFVDGWFRTGDLAERSVDGYYTLRGRMSDLIISGGFNIYPREIEELLMEFPGVREAAVVGLPDAARGEVPVAFLVTDTNASFDPAALEAACRSQLASFKVPRGFVQVDALPRTALGKVQKRALLGEWTSRLVD